MHRLIFFFVPSLLNFSPLLTPTPAPPCSISAHTEGLDNVRPPILLDAAAPDTWSVEEASCSGVICINMTHISPWAATQGLFRGASRVLKVSARECFQIRDASPSSNYP